MKHTSVLSFTLISFLLLCIHAGMPLTADCSTPPELDLAGGARERSASDAGIQEKLKRNDEKNAQEVLLLIQKHKFTEVEHFLDYVIKNKIKNRHGEDYFDSLFLYCFYTYQNGALLDEAFLAHLDAWVKQDENSVLARTVRGKFYLAWAWRARGQAWAKDVKPEQWRVFKNRLSLANLDYMSVYAMDTTNIHAQLGLFDLAVISKENDLFAVDWYRQIFTLDPTNYNAHRIRLKQLMPKWGGNWNDLFLFARETEKNAPPGSLLPLILADAHAEAAARSGDRKKYYAAPEVWADIERVYQAVTSAFPRSEKWKWRYAAFASMAGKDELAREYNLAAAELDNYDQEAQTIILELYKKAKKWELEEWYARYLLKLYPRSAQGYESLAHASLELKKFPEAIAAYTRAIELEPRNADYRIQRCWAYNWMGEYAKAIDDCSQAITFDHNNPAAYTQRAYAYQALGMIEEAAADSKAAKATMP